MDFEFYSEALDDVTQKIELWLNRFKNLNYSSTECLDVLEGLYIEQLDLTDIILEIQLGGYDDHTG